MPLSIVFRMLKVTINLEEQSFFVFLIKNYQKMVSFKYKQTLFLFCSYTILLLVASLLPMQPIEVQTPFFEPDKLVHFGLYFIFSVLLYACLKKRYGMRFYQLLTVIIISCFFGGLIEILQPLAGRSCDLYDWIFDIAGSALGAVSYFLYSSAKNKITK